MLGGRTHAEKERRKDRSWRVKGYRRGNMVTNESMEGARLPQRKHGDNRKHGGCMATAEEAW